MKQSLKMLLGLIAIAAVFLVITQLYGDTTVHISFGDDSLIVTAPRQFSHTVAYDDIESLELVELTDTGTIISGDETRRYSWGERENDSWGRYILCISRKIDNAVLIRTSDGEILVFNHESEDTTEAIREMFAELLANRPAQGAF